MKKKLALLMAAIMTVAMVPMTAFASTKMYVFDKPIVGEESAFTSTVELKKDNVQTNVEGSGYWTVEKGEYIDEKGDAQTAKYYVARPTFQVKLTLENGEFTLVDEDDADKGYKIEKLYDSNEERLESGVVGVEVKGDTLAIVTLDAATFNQSNMDGFRGTKDEIENEKIKATVAPLAKACVINIEATSGVVGNDVVAEFTRYSGKGFTNVGDSIAEISTDNVKVTNNGVVTFVEDASKDVKKIKEISIEGLVNGAIKDNHPITIKLSGNYKFAISDKADNSNGYDKYDDNNSYSLVNDEGVAINASEIVDTMNASADIDICVVDDDEIIIIPKNVEGGNVIDIILSNIYIKTDKKCSVNDVAKLTISSKDFDSVKLEVAKMVAEAVTYTVEDEELPTIWAGKNYALTGDDSNTLELSVEENTGDILNTSRKATFTFPEGIEVVGLKYDSKDFKEENFSYQIDENVVTIWNYAKGTTESKNSTDFGMKFLLNAAPTFSGDVNVTLGGEFDDVELKVATVKAPYTVEAKTSEVLIDYRYVPVNEVVITEAEEGILEEGDEIRLQVEKMDFEDAGKYEITSGDIEVEVEIVDGNKETAQLVVTVEDESTEASTITISGLELYLDRTLPVGGYALKNVKAGNERTNILWENSTSLKVDDKDDDVDKLAYDYVPEKYVAKGNKTNVNGNGLFKYSAVTVNDSYVEVVTSGRDNDDSTTTRKIVITIGATTMAVGTETVTLDTPAYINAENYTELPLRAVSEAFGATVGWDDASRTVTIMMGQRIVSMTIGSKTMYINGTPVAMNTAPEITNERTFVPVRDLANALGITKIDWNEASATVTLN